MRVHWLFRLAVGLNRLFFIGKLRFSCGAYLDFFNAEYLIALVDLIPPRGVAPEPTRLAKDEGSALHPS